MVQSRVGSRLSSALTAMQILKPRSKKQCDLTQHDVSRRANLRSYQWSSAFAGRFVLVRVHDAYDQDNLNALVVDPSRE